jgi:ABC-type multidrug transport system permease subunit
MAFLWTTAVKDLRRQRRNPLEILLWIGIPLLIGSLIIMASGGKSGVEPQAHLLVVDQDKSFLSQFLIGSLSQDAMGDLIRAESVAEEEGRSRLGKGKASALLIIPAGFGDAVLREEPTTLQLLTNPSQDILPQIVQESLSILTDATFYLQRLVGDDLRTIANGPPQGLNRFADAFISAFSVKINHIADRATRYLDPVAIKLETVKVEPTADKSTTSGQSSYSLHFLPGILLMGLLFMAQGIGDDLWKERDQRTLRRVVVSPQKVTSFLAGKLLASTAMMLAVCVIGLSAGYLYFGLSPLSLPLAVTWSTCAGLMLLLLLMQIQVRAASQRAGNIITMMLIFPLMMLGGSFFPFEVMPTWMATIGRLTPNGWAVQQLRDILVLNIDVAALMVRFTAMLALITVLFLLGAQRLRSGFAQS